MITTLALIGILMGLAAANIKGMENPLADASFQVSHFMRLARSRAISQTISIRIEPASSTELIAFSAESCDDDMDLIENFDLTLPEGAVLADTDWEVCFTQRGLSDTNLLFVLQNQKGKERSIEIALGGGVRIE